MLLEQNNFEELGNGSSKDKKTSTIIRTITILIIGIVLGAGATYGVMKSSSVSPPNTNSSGQKSSVSNSANGAGDAGTSQQTGFSERNNEAAAQEAASATKVFKDDKLGYSVTYPSDWLYQAEDNEATFNGPENTDAYYSQVDIQNDLEETNMDTMIEDIKGEYDGESPKFSDEKDYVYTMQDGTKLPGKTLKIDYTDGDEPQRDWQIIIPKDGKFFTWSYSSSLDQYDVYLGIAQNMLDSWKIDK